MSADNWATCPRCLARAQAAFAQEQASIMALYGTLSVEEFDAKRAALKTPDPDDFMTFREDYEFYGAEEGTVTASYSGGCGECGLSAELKASERFWSPGDA